MHRSALCNSVLQSLMAITNARIAALSIKSSHGGRPLCGIRITKFAMSAKKKWLGGTLLAIQCLNWSKMLAELM